MNYDYYYGQYSEYRFFLFLLFPSTSQRKEDLLIPSLVNRVKKDSINEVIIATSATVEGQTTAHYIKDSLKDTKVKISKLNYNKDEGEKSELTFDINFIYPN